MKIAYVPTVGRGVQTNAYALRTGGGGGGQKLANYCVRTIWMAPILSLCHVLFDSSK